MRNYTSPTQKSELYSAKYNLPQKEVFDILTKSEDLLTFDELKIKYDNPNIGQLPEWLTEEELDLIIWKSIHTVYNKNYSQWSTWITKEDLYMELQIWVRKISNLIDSYQTLKVSCINHMKFLLQNQMVAQNYVSYCLDNKPYENKDTDDNSQEKTLKEFIPEQSTLEQTEDVDFLNTLDSIPNKEVRDTLVVIGYLYSNISSLRSRYLDILKNCSEATKEGLLKLEEQLEHNENLQRLRIDGKQITEKQKNIKVQDIIKVMCDLTDMEELPESKKTVIRKRKIDGEQVEVEVETNVKPEEVYLQNLKYYLSNTATFQLS